LIIKDFELNKGNLHTGNVLYDPATNNVRLTDLVNSLVGLPYFYRPYIIEHKKIQVIFLILIIAAFLGMFELSLIRLEIFIQRI
jgi:hypothetical protein